MLSLVFYSGYEGSLHHRKKKNYFSEMLSTEVGRLRDSRRTKSDQDSSLDLSAQ